LLEVHWFSVFGLRCLMQHLPPNLQRARDFTRNVGPVSMAAGLVIAALGAILDAQYSALAHILTLPYGAVMVVLGLAAWARTESGLGIAARWVVAISLVIGSALALIAWLRVLMSDAASGMGDPQLIAFYLVAGPALMAPAVLITWRPAWTPLVVIPAILSLALASVIGHTALLIRGWWTESMTGLRMDDVMMMGVIACSMSILLAAVWYAVKGLRTETPEVVA
jgi:hypothetical protein